MGGALAGYLRLVVRREGETVTSSAATRYRHRSMVLLEHIQQKSSDVSVGGVANGTTLQYGCDRDGTGVVMCTNYRY